jgi:hypothetical protein
MRQIGDFPGQALLASSDGKPDAEQLGRLRLISAAGDPAHIDFWIVARSKHISENRPVS